MGDSWSMNLLSVSCDIEAIIRISGWLDNYLGHSTHSVFSTESQRSCSASRVGIKLQPLPDTFLRKNPSGCKTCLAFEQLHFNCGVTAM